MKYKDKLNIIEKPTKIRKGLSPIIRIYFNKLILAIEIIPPFPQPDLILTSTSLLVISCYSLLLGVGVIHVILVFGVTLLLGFIVFV